MEINDIKKVIKEDIKNKSVNTARSYFFDYDKNESAQIDYYLNGQFYTKNNKKCIKINYLKQLVTQKIDYILSKPVTTTNDLFNWDNIFTQLIQNASLDVVAWLHIYVKSGQLNWVIINNSQIIPIFDVMGNIKELIRYYPIPKEKGKYGIEYWTTQEVSYFELDGEKIIPLDSKPHYRTLKIYAGQIEQIEDKTFNTLPFFPLFNNRNYEDDAHDISNLLEMYNSICTGFIENIDAFQEAIVKLKNFSGDADSLQEVTNLMKKYKAVGVPADGDVDYLKVEIPVEARQVILELIKDAIYSLGRGVDVDKLISANNITNVYIKSRYQSLDFKANDTIAQCKIFYKKVIAFVNEFYNKKYKDEITFNKTLLINEKEQIEACAEAIKLKEAGVLSKETLMKNIPWVSDIKGEIKQIKSESEDINI